MATTSRKQNAYYFDAHTFSAYGSTDTKIIRFATVVQDTGSPLGKWSHSSTAANGDTWTFLKSGSLYVSCWFNTTTGGTADIGVSLNSTELTTNLDGITVNDRKSINTTSAEPGNAPTAQSSSCIKVVSNDIIRIHGDASIPNNSAACGVNFIFKED